MSNIRAIAERSNVSIATVSRVLNNHDNVSDDTRLLVLQAAQELGYPLPAAARQSMVFRSVLVLMRPEIESSAPSNPGYGAFESAVWRGVESVLTAKGVAVKLQQSPMTVADADRIASEAGVAGLILLGGVVANQFLERLQRLGVPFVAVGSHARPLQTNYVMADVAEGIRQAVDHLVARGRRQTRSCQWATHHGDQSRQAGWFPAGAGHPRTAL